MKIIQKNKYSILSNLAKYGFIFVIAFSLFTVPHFSVSACGGRNDPCPPTSSTPNPTSSTPNPTSSTPSVNVTTGIKNPLGNGITDIPSFIAAIINFVLLIGVPIVVLAIIYSGFLFVTAAGNSEKLSKAKKTLLFTLIGAALLLGAFVVAQAIQGTINDIKSTT